MRIVILTDSLGCPRKETHVSDTWVEKVIEYFKDITFYPICVHGLSATDIPISYIKELEPNYIICEYGIVDACRRGLTKWEKNFISSLPFLGKYIGILFWKFHYQMTKIRNIHDCKYKDFYEISQKLIGCSSKGVFFIEIAKPGRMLKSKVYNVENDVAKYNMIFDQLKSKKVTILKPFSESTFCDPNDYLLEIDGHHLNTVGQKLVFDIVIENIKKLECEE